jgi:hypothetical protein
MLNMIRRMLRMTGMLIRRNVSWSEYRLSVTNSEKLMFHRRGGGIECCDRALRDELFGPSSTGMGEGRDDAAAICFACGIPAEPRTGNRHVDAFLALLMSRRGICRVGFENADVQLEGNRVALTPWQLPTAHFGPRQLTRIIMQGPVLYIKDTQGFLHPFEFRWEF